MKTNQKFFHNTKMWLFMICFTSLACIAPVKACCIDPLSFSTFGDPVMFSFINTSYLNQSVINELAYKETTAPTNKTLASPANIPSTPAKLAEKYPAEQRAQIEKAFAEALKIYQQLEVKLGIPANDLAGALAAFLSGNYMAYQDVTVPDEHFMQLVNQMRNVLSGNATFASSSAAEKRQLYEEMAIVGVFMSVSRDEVNKQANNTDLKSKFRQTAKLNFEQFLSISADQLKIDNQGLSVVNNTNNPSTLPAGSEKDDNLQGTSGSDVFEGLAGKDIIDGVEGVDTASYEHAPKKVTVNLTKGKATGGAGKDKLTNIENVIGSAHGDILIGNDSDNSLSGLAGNDKLIGGAGKDTLLGGVGKDVLTGGKGADIFRFNSQATGKAIADKITDFSKAQGDLISLDATAFPNQTFVAVKKRALAKNGERVIYEKSTGRLYYDADGAGSGAAAQLLVTLTNKPALDNSALAPCQPACGNGGEDNSLVTGGQTPAFSTYRNTSLPGRLLVNSSIDPGIIFNLQDGSRVELPPLPKTIHDDTVDLWDVSANGSLLTRLSNANWRKNPVLGFFDINTLDKRSELLLPDNEIGFSGVRLSADGRYLLSFHRYQGRYDQDRLLTVFDAATGGVVEEGSKLDGELIGGFPATWAPNGEYVYMLANKLYATTPLSPTVRLIATLNLPPSTGDGRLLPISVGNMAVSPDGSKLAFAWSEFRKYDQDSHIYVVNMDGSGLHRLTDVPDKTSPLSFHYVSPTWSPDSQWVAMVLSMSGVVTAPVFPLEDNSAWKVIGTTGCGSSPVMVLPVTAENVAMSWPRIDPNLGIRIREGDHASWLTTCSGIMRWLP